MTTIAATIVSQLDGAETDGTGFAVATLAEVALVLAVISVVVNITARIIITHTSRLGAHSAPRETGGTMATATLRTPYVRRRRVGAIASGRPPTWPSSWCCCRLPGCSSAWWHVPSPLEVVGAVDDLVELGGGLLNAILGSIVI